MEQFCEKLRFRWWMNHDSLVRVHVTRHEAETIPIRLGVGWPKSSIFVSLAPAALNFSQSVKYSKFGKHKRISRASEKQLLHCRKDKSDRSLRLSAIDHSCLYMHDFNQEASSTFPLPFVQGLLSMALKLSAPKLKKSLS